MILEWFTKLGLGVIFHHGLSGRPGGLQCDITANGNDHLGMVNNVGEAEGVRKKFAASQLFHFAVADEWKKALSQGYKAVSESIMEVQ